MTEPGTERVITEEEIPLILREYNTIAFRFMERNEFENALDALSHSEDLLEAIKSQGGSIDTEIILETIHNKSLCLQRLGMFEECASYIDACIYTFKEYKAPQKTHIFLTDNKSSKIFQSRYKCKAHIQLCAIFSQLKRNESALLHAKKAVLKAKSCLKHCYDACVEHIKLHNKLIGSTRIKERVKQQQQYNLLESPHYISFHKIVTQNLPLLDYLAKIIDTERIKLPSKNIQDFFNSEGME